MNTASKKTNGLYSLQNTKESWDIRGSAGDKSRFKVN